MMNLTNQSALRTVVISLTATIGLGFASDARALIIDAVADTWLHENAPDAVRSNDLISVWATNPVPPNTRGPDQRHGAILFDLSGLDGVTIETVYLDLFDRDDSRSETEPFVQEAYVLDFTPPTFPSLFEEYTWAEYAQFDEGQNESAFGSLGAYNIAAGDTVDGYEHSDFASAADITLLQNTRNAQSGNQANLVAFVLKATSGERDWDDADVGADDSPRPPRLVINEDPPVLGDFTGDGEVNTDDYQVLIDPNNWLQPVPLGTLGDITFNGVVNLDDFGAFKPVFQAANPGVPFGTPVPEPATLGSTLVMSGLAWLAMRRRRRIKVASNAVSCPPVQRLRGPVSTLPGRTLISAAALLALAIPALAGDGITLDATTDVWFRESQPDRLAFETDLMSVWSSFGNDGARRYGLVEFDVSSLAGIDVTDAGLQLWDATNGFSDDAKPMKQTAVAIDTTGGTQAAAFTWNIYQSEYAGSATPLEGLGTYNLPEQESPENFQNSIGSDADEALIESIASSAAGNKTLTLILIADEVDMVDYAHSWGDGPDGFGGMNARLVINEPFPEDPDLALEVNSVTGAISIKNTGIDTRVDTMFDIDGYLIQSPTGALNPGGFTGLTGAGETDWDIVAPAPEALTELSLTSSIVLAEGDARSLGTGYSPEAARDLTFQYNLTGGLTQSGPVLYVDNPPGGADFDGDGFVDGADFLGHQRTDPSGIAAWQAAYGTFTATAVGTAVPEPSACLLLCGGGLALTVMRRRR